VGQALPHGLNPFHIGVHGQHIVPVNIQGHGQAGAKSAQANDN
jgi:hypothetical protein